MYAWPIVRAIMESNLVMWGTAPYHMLMYSISIPNLIGKLVSTVPHCQDQRSQVHTFHDPPLGYKKEKISCLAPLQSIQAPTFKSSTAHLIIMLHARLLHALKNISLL